MNPQPQPSTAPNTEPLANCSCPGEHRTLDVHEYEWLIHSDLMGKAKIALGETGRVETLWSS